MRHLISSTKVLYPFRFYSTLLFLIFVSQLVPNNSSYAADSNQNSLTNIISDRMLWGDDAFAVFALIGQWKNFNEGSITVFPDMVAAGSESQKKISQVVKPIKQSKARLLPKYSKLFSQSLSNRIDKLEEKVIKFHEDNSNRVIWRSDGGSFLKKDIKIKDIFSKYGKPEKTISKVIHAIGERRPVVLTFHSYANGAVKIIESDLTLSPGTVDRINLDVSLVSKEVLEH